MFHHLLLNLWKLPLWHQPRPFRDALFSSGKETVHAVNNSKHHRHRRALDLLPTLIAVGDAPLEGFVQDGPRAYFFWGRWGIIFFFGQGVDIHPLHQEPFIRVDPRRAWAKGLAKDRAKGNGTGEGGGHVGETFF